MAKLQCPKGCNAGWSGAYQGVENGRRVQRATCRGCGATVESRGGVVMDQVGDMTQSVTKKRKK